MLLRVVYGSISFELWWNAKFITTKTRGRCGYRVSRTNTPPHIVGTPASFQTSFLESVLGDLGRLSCLEHATQPSHPHSADGSSAAAIQPGGFSTAGLGKAEGPTGWCFDPSAEGAVTTAPPLLSLLIYPRLSFCHRAAVSPCRHTLQPS